MHFLYQVYSKTFTDPLIVFRRPLRWWVRLGRLCAVQALSESALL